MKTDPEQEMFNRLWPAVCTRCGKKFKWVTDLDKGCMEGGHHLVHDEEADGA